MVTTPLHPQFRVLISDHGRRCLWPATKTIPPGWREALPASSKEECLAFVGRALDQPAPPSTPITFSLMFFGGDEGKAAHDKYRTVIEAARFADAHGFAALWLPERHFTALGSLYPNPAVLHAALARETKHLRLRAGSVVLPLHDPIRVAEEWAVVDNLSEGRVEISFAPAGMWKTSPCGPTIMRSAMTRCMKASKRSNGYGAAKRSSGRMVRGKLAGCEPIRHRCNPGSSSGSRSRGASKVSRGPARPVPIC